MENHLVPGKFSKPVIPLCGFCATAFASGASDDRLSGFRIYIGGASNKFLKFIKIDIFCASRQGNQERADVFKTVICLLTRGP
jgi:hypothetical protein